MFRASRPAFARVRLPAGLRVMLALFYLTLGLSAAWHAPHFSSANLSIGNDRHEHHEAVNGDACALCTVKNAPHQAGASVAPFVEAGGAPSAHAFVAGGERAHFRAFRARGPPALS